MHLIKLCTQSMFSECIKANDPSLADNSKCKLNHRHNTEVYQTKKETHAVPLINFVSIDQRHISYYYIEPRLIICKRDKNKSEIKKI